MKKVGLCALLFLIHVNLHAESHLNSVDFSGDGAVELYNNLDLPEEIVSSSTEPEERVTLKRGENIECELQSTRTVEDEILRTARCKLSTQAQVGMSEIILKDSSAQYLYSKLNVESKKGVLEGHRYKETKRLRCEKRVYSDETRYNCEISFL